MVTNIEESLNNLNQEFSTQGEVTDEMLANFYIDLQEIGINEDLVKSLDYTKGTINVETVTLVQLKVRKTNHTLIEFLLTDKEKSIYTFTNIN